MCWNLHEHSLLHQQLEACNDLQQSGMSCIEFICFMMKWYLLFSCACFSLNLSYLLQWWIVSLSQIRFLDNPQRAWVNFSFIFVFDVQLKRELYRETYSTLFPKERSCFFYTKHFIHQVYVGRILTNYMKISYFSLIQTWLEKVTLAVFPPQMDGLLPTLLV